MKVSRHEYTWSIEIISSTSRDLDGTMVLKSRHAQFYVATLVLGFWEVKSDLHGDRFDALTTSRSCSASSLRMYDSR